MACCSPWSHTVKHNLVSEQETPLFLVQSSRVLKSNRFALHWQQCASVCADDGGRARPSRQVAQTWQDGPQLRPCPPKVTTASTYCGPGKSSIPRTSTSTGDKGARPWGLFLSQWRQPRKEVPSPQSWPAPGSPPPKPH